MRLTFNHLLQPFSAKEVCSICRLPYNPDAARGLPESLTMHFCPRDTCQTAWHRQCLSAHPIIRNQPTCADRKLSLMCSIPSDLLNLPPTSTSSPSLLSLLLKQIPAPSRSQPNTRKRGRDFEADALSSLEDLPEDLVELASQPTIKPTLEPSEVFGEPTKKRKGREGAPPEPGNVISDVAGNIATVLRARVLVNDVLRGTTVLHRDWRKKIGYNSRTIPCVIVDDDENRPCPPLLCPTCGEHI